MNVVIASIVEGHGEVDAVPELVRRVAAKEYPGRFVRVLPPIRKKRGKLLKADELEKAVELAARKVAGGGAVLILLDSDDDCPAVLGPQILDRAVKWRGNVPIAVVLAKREYEAWFLAASASLAGQRGLNHNLVPPADPESIRGAKEWLGERMQPGSTYTETLDQLALTKRFDLDTARSASSFDKCYREITRLIAASLSVESS